MVASLELLAHVESPLVNFLPVESCLCNGFLADDLGGWTGHANEEIPQNLPMFSSHVVVQFASFAFRNFLLFILIV